MMRPLFAVFAIVMFVIDPDAQNSTSGPITGQTLPLSASVLGTIANRGNEVVLVILWRGTPMWFAKSAHQGASYSGGVGGRPFSATLDYGGLQLEAVFDANAHDAQVQGKAVAMPPGSNVILVDEIDSGRAPVLRGGITVTPQKDPGDHSLATLFERSPDIVSFLRCDPSNAYRVVNRIVCDDLGKR